MADRVIVVDDDEISLKLASNILSSDDMRVSVMTSGQALIDYMNRSGDADLILLDVKMPDMDGFETLKALRKTINGIDVPVIFLTGDGDEGAEVSGLELGAVDFIKKPFVPEVLRLRVRHTIELDHLQRALASEVDKKTQENESLFVHVVLALASAIDAKDPYTNGHSARVAHYSREIARRLGYDRQGLERIYIMGLLHDVGKIGIPDAVINKPDKLTDEEYELIKTHPMLGAKILGEIKEMPALANGARWHHERYDGTGYPDGLSGEDIPKEARIIAVADSYDAMTSRNRSYRQPLTQSDARQEFVDGIGTQFDPDAARCMIDMIDEDVNFDMREK